MFVTFKRTFVHTMIDNEISNIEDRIIEIVRAHLLFWTKTIAGSFDLEINPIVVAVAMLDRIHLATIQKTAVLCIREVALNHLVEILHVAERLNQRSIFSNCAITVRVWPLVKLTVDIVRLFQTFGRRVLQKDINFIDTDNLLFASLFEPGIDEIHSDCAIRLR